MSARARFRVLARAESRARAGSLVIYGGEALDGSHYGDGFYLLSQRVASEGGGAHYAAHAMKLADASPAAVSGHALTFVAGQNTLVLTGGVLRGLRRGDAVAMLTNARSVHAIHWGVAHPPNKDPREEHGANVKTRNGLLDSYEFCSCVNASFYK